VNTRAPFSLAHSGAVRAPEQGRVTARIDTLVLRGFPPMIPARVEEAFAGEFTRLLREAALSLPVWSEPPAGDMLPLRLKFHTQPTARTVGRELARAIFEQIVGREEARP
jgi:hypothetical protein